MDIVVVRAESLCGLVDASFDDALGLTGPGTHRPAVVCQDVLYRATRDPAALGLGATLAIANGAVA